jgi:hypothetical protein
MIAGQSLRESSRPGTRPMMTALQNRLGLAGRVVEANMVFVSLVLAHYLMAEVVSRVTGVPIDNGIIAMLTFLVVTFVPACLLILLVWRLGYMIAKVRPDRPIAWLAADIRRVLLDPERLLGGAVALVGIAAFQRSFAYLKDMVPVLHPFSWDQTFLDWDRALHFGTDPYVYLMPLVSTPWVIAVLNGAYHLWLLMVIFLLFVAGFDRTNPRARMTFLVAHVLTWAIGGNLLATVFSSAGPVYLERLGMGDAFVPLMATLHQMAQHVPLPALDVQEMLWQGYVADGPISGISAMPSMHLASTTLMTLYAFTWRRWAGRAMVGFWVLIMIGSVALGWHYAIDGYLGAALALAFWCVAGRMVPRDNPAETALRP